ncbi:tandem-95 repeat protein [Cellvibrio japonicus]|nr:tandem-95 repeat protein [Cellvibrio japonicus]QEI14451.1 tandem-95 repeat protein [Cellvibrio japonicus]QEI18029.1 tandem-95 repeat protein [Cellvibrio japonicus]
MPVSIFSIRNNVAFMLGYFFRKYLFLLPFLIAIQSANAATFDISTPTQEGTFTLTWSGARTYVEIYELVGTTRMRVGHNYGINGSLSIAKSPGTYTYILVDVYMMGAYGMNQPIPLRTEYQKTVVVTPPTVPPAVLSSLMVTPNPFSETISVSWDGLANAIHYELQRNGSLVYSGAATSTTPSGSQANTSYTFRVRACNTYGCSDWKTANAVTLPETFGVPATSTTGQYSIYAQTPPTATYTRIEERVGTSGSWITLTTLAGSQSYSVTRANGTYYYRLFYCVANGQSLDCTPRHQEKSTIVSQPVPVVSASFNAATINEGGTATLNWSSTHATACSATGISGVSGTSGSVTFQAPTVMSGNQTVSIPVTCTGGGGSKTATASLTINWINDLPTLSAIGNRTINEDASTGAIAFTLGDEETPAANLTVTATSSNATLIPNANIQLGGSGTNRTINVTPAANAFGSATITVRVTDAHGGQAQQSFTVTVNAVDDVPVISAINNVSVNELAETTVNFTVTDIDSPVSGITVTSSANGTVTPVLSGSGNNYSVKLTAGRITSTNSSAQATMTVRAPFGSSAVTRTFTVTVNNLTPQLWIEETGTTGIYDLKWEYGTQGVRLFENGVDITASSSGSASAVGSRRITKTANGTFTYYLQDCVGVTQAGLVCQGTHSQKSITVAFPKPVVNASFNRTAVNEANAGAANTTANLSWSSTHANSCTATGISGVSSTSGTVTYTAPATLVSSQTHTVTVICTGNGGSISANASITLTALNDVPTFSTIGNRIINEDTNTGAIAFTVGDEETPVANLTVSATSSNTALIPNGNLVFGGSGANRTLTVTPTANAFGSATITVRVIDAQGGQAQQLFAVTINPVNDAPTLSAIANITINEDTSTGARAFTVGDVDTPVANLVVTAISSNTALVPNGNIALGGSGANRTVNVTPIANVHGTATITVTVSDGQLTASRSFVVTVNPVNDAPTISAIANITIDEDASTGVRAFTIGDIDTPVANLIVSATSSNTTLVPNTNIVLGGSSTSRTINITPVANGYGTATITVTVSDGQLNTSRSFVVTVNSVNDAPTISTMANITIDEDTSTGARAFTISDIDTSVSSLTVTATSSNTTLVPNTNIALGGSGANRTVNITPVANGYGTATITVTVSDGQLSTSRSFVVTVSPINDAPTISTIANITIDEDTSTGVRAFTIGDIDTPIANLTISASSSNTALVPNTNIVLGGSSTSRTINITPVANSYGSATITVTVSDGQLNTSRSFVVTVNSINDAPTISTIANITINEDTSTGARAFTIADIDTPVANLTVTFTSSNTTLVPHANIILGGNGANRTVNVMPVANGNGAATITVTVSDGQLTASRSFVVTVNPVNDAPTISAIANITIDEDTSTGARPFTIADIDTPVANLTVTATSSNTALVPHANITLGGSGASRTINVTPVASGHGTTTMTVTVSDGQLSASRSFVVTVNSVNDVPVISTFSNRTIDEDTSTGVVLFTVDDEETAAASLIVSATSSNTALVPNNRLVLGGSGTNRTLTVAPLGNAFGVTTITVTVTDAGGASAQRSFVLTVNAVNDLPTITPIPEQRITAGTSAPTLNFTIGDIETPAASLSVTTSSDKPGLIATSGIVLGGSGATRTLKITPVVGQSGLAMVTIKVTDADGGESTLSVKVSVSADTSITFDMANAPASFIHNLTDGVTNLGSGDFVAITQGALNVDGGAASYKVAIDLPPAIRDLAPTLGLNYNSHGSDGVMGVGWFLSGLSSIHRCRATFASEGAEAQKSNPQYTQGDRLCLDGQKLVIAGSSTPANNSAYWAANAIYQTEIDSFTRIQAHGSHEGGPQYFTLTTKDGRTLTFGEEATNQKSRIYAPGQPNGPISNWMLDKVEDRYGNRYQVYYLRDTVIGEHYPSHITWAPESAVVFSYIDRTGNTPWGYDGGHQYVRTKLLDKVTTYIGITDSSTPTAGTRVREYDIDYQLSATTNRHLVKEIRECGFTSTGVRQCAKPLQFEWQMGELGFEQAGQPLAYEGVLYEDINNDGFVDVIGEKSILAWGSATGFVAANDSADEFLRTIQTRFGKYMARGVLRGDYVDIKIIRMSPSGMETSSTVVSLTKANLPQVHAVDLNNDGLTDLYIGGHLWIQQSDASFVESLATVTYPYEAPSSYSGIQPHFVDINNDGLLDRTGVSFHGLVDSGLFNNVLYGALNEVDKFGAFSSSMRVSSVSPATKVSGVGHIDAPLHYRYTSNIGFWHSWIDINGDGHADVLYADKHSGAPQWRIRLSTGDGQSYSLQPLITSGASVVPMNNVALGQYSFVMDYNKDGVDDFIVFFSSGPGERVMRVFYGSYVNGTLSFVNGGVDPLMGKLGYLVGLDIVPGEQTINPFRGDINNDGIPDLVIGGAAYFGKQQQPDLLSKVTDGFGAIQELGYSPLVDDDNNGKPLYTPDAVAPAFPQAPASRGMQVVKQLSVSNGLGGQVHTWFHYTGGKQDLQGRGFLGFAKIETTSTSSGVETATHYLQGFPYTGRISEVLIKDSVSGNLISRTQNHYTTHSHNGRFPYLDYSIQQDYQLLTTSLNTPLAVNKVENSFDVCGNLIGRTTTTGTGLSGITVTGILGTATLTNTLINTSDSDCSDDFVSETTVTYTEAGDINPRTVTTTFEPNAQFDVYQQTVFEGTALEVVTTTNRNEQGTITDTGAIAADLNSTNTAARITSFSDLDKGIYPEAVTNAAGHIVTLSYDYRFGKVNQEADPNSLISSRDFDVLGRNVRETAADGAITELLSWYCASAPVTCPSHAVYLTATRVTHPSEPGKLGAPLAITYYDSLQRVVRNETHSLNQAVVKSDTQYTAAGYVHRVSEPFTGFASHWTTYSDYDALGRANTIIGPDGGSLGVTYSLDANRLKTSETVTVVTPNSTDIQTTRRYTNALGQVVRVEDARGTPVDYTYDAQGNLKTTIVNNNALTTITVVHDLASNKTRITDPDAGVIDFAYNGFGELRKQTWQPDLTGHTKSITYTYDDLGRKTHRIDQPASGNATSYSWVWDAPGQLGLLSSQSGNGYSENYTYDPLSRVQTQTTSITGLAGGKVFTYGYDSFSRPATTTYPNGLTITRDYQASGMHVRTRDVTGSTDNTLWVLGKQQNNRGQLTHALYGNGVVTAHTYTDSNGRLASITSGRLTASNTLNSLNGDIQALSYEFDSLGNLRSRTTKRSDNNGLAFENTTERFAYDKLNRVTASTTSGLGLFNRSLDYQYDDLGNLTYRSDTGALAYNRTGNAGVHAVTSSGTSGTPDYKTYAYDRYGNMTSRGGETISYDVFNKPLTINGSNGTSSFSYGPNHERFKQITGGKTTYVINGGAYEEIVDNNTGTVTQKSYVDGFMVQTKTGTTTDITYLHKDHLGSTEAMTDANGNLTGRMSFGVWGQRQQASWQTGTPPTTELNSFKTQQGYTGHEQLDNHDLIHMGGRVYDPTIGRFLSADLYIQSPYNTQSFNRYSYVFNNPLSRIDPTGYFSDMMQWAMESSYQHASGWFWNASYQAAQAQINYSQAKKAAERAANQGTPTVWMEELPRDEKEELQSTSKQKNGNGLSLDGAQEGLKPTEAEYKLISEGKLAEMWQGRCAAGDPIGCVGFATWGDPADVLAMHGKVDGAYWVGVGATVRFNARNGLLTGNPELLLNPDALNTAVLSFGKAIATAHLDATAADLSGRHYFLRADEITQYHHVVFDRFNVSRRWYGGSYGTGRHEPLLEPFYCRPSCDSN